MYRVSSNSVHPRSFFKKCKKTEVLSFTSLAFRFCGLWKQLVMLYYYVIILTNIWQWDTYLVENKRNMARKSYFQNLNRTSFDFTGPLLILGSLSDRTIIDMVFWLQVLVRWFSPTTELCIIEPWCREIGFVICYGAIILKLYRYIAIEIPAHLPLPPLLFLFPTYSVYFTLT